MIRNLIFLVSCFFTFMLCTSGFSAQIYQDIYDANIISEFEPIKFNTDLHFLVGEKQLKKVSDLDFQGEQKQIFIVDERVKKVLEEKERQILSFGKKEENKKKEDVVVSKIVEVHFNFDSYKLVRTEEEKLVKELDSLKKDGFLRVKVWGYADLTGKTRYNLWLSRKRAEVVAEFLRKHGFEVIEVKGLGELDKDNVLCLNRKVVITFEKKPLEEK